MAQNLGDNVTIYDYYAKNGYTSGYVNGGGETQFTSYTLIANQSMTITGRVRALSDDTTLPAIPVFQAPKIIINNTGSIGILIRSDNPNNKITFNDSSVNFDNAIYNGNNAANRIGPISFTGTSSINITSNTNGKTIIKASTLTGTVTLDVDEGVQDGDTFLIEATDNQLVITDGEWSATASTSGNVTTYTLEKSEPVPVPVIGKYNKKLLRKKLALMLANLKKKRKYYCEVEYLESTGTQYIDTGLNYFADFEVGIKLRNNVSNKALGNTATNCLERNNATAHNWRFSSNGSWDSNIDILEYHIMKWKEGKIYADDVLLTEKVKNKNVGYNMGLFCAGVQKFKNMIYFCKLWNPDDGTLVRDFIPVLDWDMTPCMYDRVSEQLFYNQGTGDFIAGRQIHYVDYLESTGTQYIDTGIQPTDDYGYKIRNTYTRGGGEQCAIGCMDNGNRFVGVYTSGAENQLSGAWGSFVGFLPAYAWATGDILDVEVNYKNSRKMIVGGTELKDISDVHISGTISNTLYLFARHYGSTITKMVGKMYGVEITNGNDVVGDFIPAIDENGVGFMLDKVSHTIYDNAGTDVFKYPARETEYIEVTDLGTNNQNPCIDLGLKYKPSMSIESKYTRTEMGVSGSVLPLSNSTTQPLIYMPALNASAKTDRFVWRRSSLPESSYYYDFADYPMTVEFKVDAVNDVLTVNGNVVKTGMIEDMNGYESPYESNSNLYMLSINGTYGGMGKVYYVKLYDSTQVYRDLIPVWKDGVACVYDKQNDTYYSNTKTGTVICGKIIEPRYE